MSAALIPLLVLALAGASPPGPAPAPAVSRHPGESAAELVQRVRPGATLAYPVIETTDWLPGERVVLALFVETYTLPPEADPDQREQRRAMGHVYLPTGSGGYTDLPFGAGDFDTEGSSPHIEAVFLANADKDPQKELVVICSWEQVHADVEGTLYATAVYDLATGEGGAALTKLPEVSDAVSGGCDCAWTNGTSKTARFKSARQVRRGLRKLGY